MFMAVPPSYDLLNRMLTLRLDQVWRKKAAIECLGNNPSATLDLCCGTGDLVLHLARLASSGIRLAAMDFSEPMLDLARNKAEAREITGIDFVHGDVASMPFPDGHFDSIGIAFAFRNLTFRNPDRDRFLTEILRVLKPGGRFVIVETSQPKNAVLRRMFHFYLRWITAPAGGIISGHYGAYRYLAHSAKYFHDSVELRELLQGAGFSGVKSQLLMGGIAGIFTAYK
jgi:demethylmenaquinone methyltransferase / 2-methoxy-6-polyprenyl-1,4-benzoquinol methylase